MSSFRNSTPFILTTKLQALLRVFPLFKAFIITSLIISLSACGSFWGEEYGILKSDRFNENVIPRLTKALNDTDPNVRIDALKLIEMHGQKAVEAKHKVKNLTTTDKNSKVRARAKKTLIAIVPYKDPILESERKMYVGFNFPDKLELNGKDDIEITIEPEPIYFNGHDYVDMIKQAKILPVKFTIKNTSDYIIKIDPDAIQLTSKWGLLSNMNSHSLEGQAQYNTKNTWVKFALLGPFAIKNTIKLNKANAKIKKHLLSTLLKAISIEPKGSHSGYVYFSNIENTNMIINAKFMFTMMVLNNRKKYSFVRSTNRDIPTEISYKKMDEGEIFAMQTDNYDPKQEKNSIKPVLNKDDIKLQEIEKKLTALKSLHNKKLITEENYQQEKTRLLQQL